MVQPIILLLAAQALHSQRHLLTQVLDYARMLQQVTERQEQRWLPKLNQLWHNHRFGKTRKARVMQAREQR